jgi:hypothetical protein
MVNYWDLLGYTGNIYLGNWVVDSDNSPKSQPVQPPVAPSHVAKPTSSPENCASWKLPANSATAPLELPETQQ